MLLLILTVCGHKMFHPVSLHQHFPLLWIVCAGAQAYGGYSGVNLVKYSNFTCTANEDTLLDCTHSEKIACSNKQLAGASCTQQQGGGPCETAGHLSCCDAFCRLVANSEVCYCSQDCHEEGDCCADINTTCPATGL